MSKFRLDKIAQNFQNLKRTLPPVIGNMGQNFFRQSFEKQGWTDETFTPWKQVQRRIPGTPAYKYPKKNAADRHSRAILIGLRTKGGVHLRDSVNRSLKTAEFDNISFAVSQKYAAVHNFGGPVKNFVMPQRKFMGHSATLLRMIDGKVIFAMNDLNK